MEIIFRQRLDRPDKQGRAQVFADLHWAGGHRWKVPTGVTVLPHHFQPAKTRRIHTGAENSNQHNLRLTRLQTALEDVFQKAQADKRMEASVTTEELKKAIEAVGAGGQRRAKVEAADAASDGYLPATATWQELHDRWQAENQGMVASGTLRVLQQCVHQLNAFDPNLRIGALTRERLAQYTAWLHAQGKKDTTVSRHYWFLRECFRLTGKPAPRWTERFTVRFGRAMSLQRAEILTIVGLDLKGPLAQERDAFLFQWQLLLRDSDLRNLKPHHVRPHDLPGLGARLCAELYQDKTSEPVLVPLPPLAAIIWERYEGQLSVRTNAHRNVLIKQLGELAGLTRTYVDVSFSGKTRHENVMPVWQAMSTHTARHTGAALLVWASDGDQTLKECALGHISDSVYGYDSVERYGPLLLKAWEKIMATGG